MIAVSLLEALVVVLLVVGFVTQVAVPLLRGTRLYPMFTREAELRAEAAEIEQAARERALEARIARRRSELRLDADDHTERAIRLDTINNNDDERQGEKR